MKLRSVLLGATLFTCTFSTTQLLAGINAADGFYIGAGIGVFSNDAVQGSASHSSAFGNSIFYLSPLFLGFRINDYAAVEGGYTSFIDSSHNANDIWGPDHYKLDAFDIVGKLIFPFANGFSVYGKAGLAYTRQNVYNQVFISSPAPSADTNTSEWLPLIGVGMSYNFTQQFAIGVSGSHIQGSGAINNIDMAGVDLSYTFG